MRPKYILQENHAIRFLRSKLTETRVDLIYLQIVYTLDALPLQFIDLK
jgi:hypothetical protein